MNHFRYLVFVTCLLSGAQLKGQCFTDIAPSDEGVMPIFNYTNVYDMAMAPNGDIYVVFDDADYGYGEELTVLRYHGNTWEIVGTRGFSTPSGAISRASIRVLWDGTVYVSYYKTSGGVYFKKFDGTNWVNPTGLTITYPSSSMEVDTSHNIYIPSFYNDTLKIYKYDGLSTSLYTSGCSTTNFGNYFSFTISQNGTPFIAHTDYSTSKLCVKKFDGSSWLDVGLPNFSGSSAYNIDIVVDSTESPFVIYRDALFSGKAQVKKFDGVNWVSIGGASISSGPADYCQIIISPTNNPYICYTDELLSSQGEIFVKKFNGASWDNTGVSDSTRIGIGAFAKIAFAPNDSLYITYPNEGFQVKVFKEPYWEYILKNGITRNESSRETMVYDAENNKFYFAFVDVKLRDRITVLSYQAGVWDTVGRIGFTASPTFDYVGSLRLALDTNNAPYIVFRDFSTGSKLSVMKFNGTSWVYVGAPGFSNNNGIAEDFLIDKNNVPYVAYRCLLSTWKANVKYYNGSSWISLGSPDFSPGNVVDMHIAMDTNEVAYVAFRDAAVSYKVSCMTFDGTTWVFKGLQGFSPTNYNLSDFIIEPATNFLYVLYKDPTFNAGNCMKFDGTTWNYHGPANFAAGVTGKMLFNGNILFAVVGQSFYTNIGGGSWTQFGTLSSGWPVDLAKDEDGTFYMTHLNRFLFLDRFHYETIPAIDDQPINMTVCNGGPGAFGITVTGIASSYNYQWQVNAGSGFNNLFDDATYSGSNNNTLNISSVSTPLDSYSYQCIVSNVCGADTSIAVTANLSVPDAAFSVTDTACLTSPSESLVPIVSGGTFSGTGVSGNEFYPGTAGLGSHLISYVLTDSVGCVDSSQQTIVVDNCLGIEEISSQSIKIFPSPFTTSIEISSALPLEHICVFDQTGNLVYETSKTGNSIRIDLSFLDRGVYYLKTPKSGAVIIKN